MTSAGLHLLLVEDSADDAELIGFALRDTPFAFSLERVETERDFAAALTARPPDVILCDYHLPRFSMRRALQIVREERALDTPFIVVSRLIGEDAAVEAMRNGADDYLLKGRLGRLPAAIAAQLERIESRRERARTEAALRRSDLLNRSLLDSIVMRIAVLDGDGAILATNGAWERHRAGETSGAGVPGVGGNYLDFLAAPQPDEANAAGAIRAGIEEVIARTADNFVHEYQVPRRSPRWESLRAVPLADSGQGAVVSIDDVTPRMLAHLALRDANKRLQELSRRVLQVQEDERRAIALELHDDIGQSLAALKIALHALHGRVPAEEAARAAQCLEITEETLDKLRRLSYSLRPPQLDQFGLEGALRALAEQQRSLTGIAIDCMVSGLDRRPDAMVEGACYRIAQEALNNATRHAKAKHVVIQLDARERLLQLAVRDDGVGFEEEEARRRAAASGSLGLIGMAERAQLAGGWFKVRSAKGLGTRISATFPMDGAARPLAPDAGG